MQYGHAFANTGNPVKKKHKGEMAFPILLILQLP